MSEFAHGAEYIDVRIRLEELLSAFGPERVIFGTDYPFSVLGKAELF